VMSAWNVPFTLIFEPLRGGPPLSLTTVIPHRRFPTVLPWSPSERAFLHRRADC